MDCFIITKQVVKQFENCPVFSRFSLLFVYTNWAIIWQSPQPLLFGPGAWANSGGCRLKVQHLFMERRN
jgi:hypothetical protein